jgi:23S rRNA (pseudouridine1915-N3)-methyltransferase
MKIKLICISDSDKHFASAIAEYEKRLWRDLEIITVKPEKNGTRDQIIAKETTKVVEKLTSGKDDDFVIFLAKEGKQLTTEWFAEVLDGRGSMTFVIWGPYGLDNTVMKEYVDMMLSFGGMTMPHGLAKLVVLEQVYRVGMIRDGREYHY